MNGIADFFYISIKALKNISLKLADHLAQLGKTQSSPGNNLTFPEQNLALAHVWTRYEHTAVRDHMFKSFFMFNSAENEILNARKYKNIKKFNIFQTQISLECYFSCSCMLKCQLLWHFNIYDQRKISCSAKFSMKMFYYLGVRLY